MSEAIMMTCINVAEFVLISQFQKGHSMIEMRRLKNVVISIQKIFIPCRNARDVPVKFYVTYILTSSIVF